MLARDVWSLSIVNVVVVIGVGLILGLAVGAGAFFSSFGLTLGTLDLLVPRPIGPQTSMIASSRVRKISLSGSPSHASAWLSIVMENRLWVSRVANAPVRKVVRDLITSSTS